MPSERLAALEEKVRAIEAALADDKRRRFALAVVVWTAIIGGIVRAFTHGS